MFSAYRLIGLRSLQTPLCRHLVASVKHVSKKSKLISNGCVVYQDGLSIMEMPLLVRVVNGTFMLHENRGSGNGTNCGDGPTLVCEEDSSKLKALDFEEEAETMLGFEKCNALAELFTLVSTCSEAEVTPGVALIVLRKMFELESNFEFQNPGSDPYQEHKKTFVRSALIKQLIETVCLSDKPEILLEGLNVIRLNPRVIEDASHMEPLLTECMVKITEGAFAVTEVCDALAYCCNLGKAGQFYVDKLWVGINNKTDLTVEEILAIMKILPKVMVSRAYYEVLVEKKAPLVWSQFQMNDIHSMLDIMVQLNLTNTKLLKMISGWTKPNIHKIFEKDLRGLLMAFRELNYTDAIIQETLVHYIKAVKDFNDPSAVAGIFEYCKAFGVRSEFVMDFGVNYLMNHRALMTTPQVGSLVKCLGHVNYLPEGPLTNQFLKAVEQYLAENMAQYPPDEALDILLSFVQLRKFPLNFVDWIFNSFFISSIHTMQPESSADTFEKAKIFDMALSLESDLYKGPYLSKYKFRQAKRDMRCANSLSIIKGVLIEFAGNEDRMTMSSFVQNLPYHKLYLVDCLIDMKGTIGATNESKNIAVCILVPEDFDSTETYLNGPQAMKQRHLEIKGYTVVCLRHSVIQNLQNHPMHIKIYVESQFKAANL